MFNSKPCYGLPCKGVYRVEIYFNYVIPNDHVVTVVRVKPYRFNFPRAPNIRY